MSETSSGGDSSIDLERAATSLGLLESRRAVIDQATWQAPTLTIAAQAFLLTVLTNENVSDTARRWILVAGVAACAAAIASLARLRAREIQYSEAIASICEKAGLPDPRPFGLGTKHPAHNPGRVDRLIRRLGGWHRLPSIYLFWIAALVLFIAADVVAYFASI